MFLFIEVQNLCFTYLYSRFPIVDLCVFTHGKTRGRSNIMIRCGCALSGETKLSVNKLRMLSFLVLSTHLFSDKDELT